MHMMVEDILLFHRAEGSKPHMQCHMRNRHAHPLNLSQQFLRKMKPCRRRGSGTLIPGIYCLITVLIFKRMCDVGRKRHLTLVLDKETGEYRHRVFSDLPDYLRAGDCLVINDTKVIPARLIGTRLLTEGDGKGTAQGAGAQIELLLLKRRGDDVWETLVKPGKKAKPGTRISFGGSTILLLFIQSIPSINALPSPDHVPARPTVAPL